ncbi:unnamed protein product, partial [Coregonus sp. 'balchen']
DCIFIPEKEFILEETERTVSTACQTDPWVPKCSCAAVEKRSTGTITKELEAQLDCAHDHQYTIESCPCTPQMELTESESEISEDQDSLKLKELFNVCHEPRCRAGVISSSLKINGFAIMETECVVGHRRKWESQTRVGKLFAGNLLVPSVVFLTGSSHSTFVETCHLLSLMSMSLRQFVNQQRIYIVPNVLKEKWITAVHHITNEHQWVTGDTLNCCKHPPYTPEEEGTRPWLNTSSAAYEAVRKFILNPRLLKDLEKDTTKEGVLRFKQEFSKAARAFVVKPIKEEKT